MALSERGPAQDNAALGDGREGSSPHPPLELRRPAAADGSTGGEPPSPTPLASNGDDGSEPGSPKLQPTDSKQSIGSDTGSGDGSSSPEQTHYDSSKDVVLRLEFLSTPEVKALFRTVRVSVLVGLGMLAVAIYLKVDKPNDYYLSDQTVPILNICFAAVLLPALLACWALFIWRVYRSNLSGKRWSHRRKRAATLAGAEITIQTINCTFYLIPNAYVMTHDCAWFDPVVIWSGFVRWSCWNSLFLLFWVQASSVNPARSQRYRKHISRPDAAVMDAPLWCHYRKLALWVVLEGILIALSIVARTDHAEFYWDPAITDCRQQGWTCQFSAAAITLLSLNVACLVAYFIMWLWNIARSFNNLKYLPYGSMRMANLVTRMQVRLRGLGITFFVLCVVVYTFGMWARRDFGLGMSLWDGYVKLSTCSSYIISWLGYLVLVASVTAMASGYMWMPKRPHEMGILQAWLAEFAWTEGDIPRKRSERASSLPLESFEHFCIDCEPLFCFETAVKMLYWSFLVYDHDEMKASPFNPTTALSLYDLEHFEVFWEKQLDTKCCVGWNEDTVVISFRGTSSLKNVQADLQVWRSRFPAGIGSLLLGTAPLVHSGFLCAYTANGFNERLLSRLESILFRCTSERAESGNERPVNVYVTGHSLGGALASLCAFDIKKRCPCAEYLVNVRCYTFGAPRVGNRAWARQYNQAVPDTWHIINSDDVVTSAGKFFFLYTRTGHRVLINKLGDIIVRPTYLESQIRQMVGGGSVKDHLLTQYQKAISSVVAAQFGRKQFKHGKDGVLSLARSKGTRDVLETAGLAGHQIEVLQSQGWDAYQKLLRQEARAKARQRSRRRRAGSRDAAELEAASMVGWERGGSLAHTLSGISLDSSASGGSSPTSSAAGRGSTGVRGSMRDTGSSFPLVLDWTGSGDAEALAGASSGGSMGFGSGRRELPEAAYARAVAEHEAARRGTAAA
ncbi:hypothetical protein COHA_001905 [Chlorella ohadii]|uniref:Fungal lipase-type domain-containing protein n=1 Tax=Chlorella ohadii TaxID=2649997 RepID=A0AAD5DUF3_9CHLO|nr:hypothetical protein COHA_001905 [Chlorella ohadii]